MKMKLRYPFAAILATSLFATSVGPVKLDSNASDSLSDAVAQAKPPVNFAPHLPTPTPHHDNDGHGHDMSNVIGNLLKPEKSIVPYSSAGYAKKESLAQQADVQIPYAHPIVIVPSVTPAQPTTTASSKVTPVVAQPAAKPATTKSKANYLVLPGTQVADFQKLAKAAGYKPGAADNIGGQKLLTVMQQDIPKMEKLAGTTNPDGHLSATEISAATSNTTDKNTLARLAFYQTLNDTKNPNTGKSHMATFYTPAAQAATSAPIKKTTRADFADAQRVPTLKLPGTIALEFEKNLQRAGHIVTLDNQLGADELFAMQRDIVNIESTHDLNINGYLGSGIGGDMDQVFNDVHSDERKKELGITAMTAEARDDLVDRLAFYRHMVQTDSVPGGEMVSLIDHFYQPDFDVVESAIERYEGPNLNNDSSNKFIDFTYTHTPTKDAETNSTPQQPAPSKVAPLPAPPA